MYALRIWHEEKQQQLYIKHGTYYDISEDSPIFYNNKQFHLGRFNTFLNIHEMVVTVFSLLRHKKCLRWQWSNNENNTM